MNTSSGSGGYPTRYRGGGKRSLQHEQAAEDQAILTPDDIQSIAPRWLILRVIRGIRSESGFFVSVMLDKDDAGQDTSFGTGKLFVTDDGSRKPYCNLLRKSGNTHIAQLCAMSDRRVFDETRQLVGEDSSYEGRIYSCAGGLSTVAVPITEKETGAFVGTILAGQKRPAESRWAARRRLRAVVAASRERSLEEVPFRTLFRNFLAIEQVNQAALDNQRRVCREFARELGEIFSYFARVKRLGRAREKEQLHTLAISKTLIQASTIDEFWGALPEILQQLTEWLELEWSVAFRCEEAGNAVVVARAGKAPVPTHIRDVGAFPNGLWSSSGLHQAVPLLPESLRRHVSPHESAWLLPVKVEEKPVGALLLGKRLAKRTGSTAPDELLRAGPKLEELCNLIALEYRELNALNTERVRRLQLEATEEELGKTISQLNDTLVTTNHQMNRPLIGIHGILSLVRDRKDEVASARFGQILDLALLWTKHASVMSRGMAKILAAESGRQFEINPVRINGNEELRVLADMLRRTSGRGDLRVEFTGVSPEILMDRDSFLFVFYNLVDNALKYADPHTTITLAAEKEYRTQRFALKVKSRGEPIHPGDVESVFRKFWRGEHAARADEAGLGVGCWAAREHMRRQGGELELEVDGRISVFIVYPKEVFWTA